MKIPAPLQLALAASLMTALAFAQSDPPEPDGRDPRKPGWLDPYTRMDPDLMKAAGIVGYGPFPWADFKTTDDIEQELGKGRILWLETAHFRIGSNLGTMPWPDAQEKRKHLKDEIKALRKKLPKFPAKPRELDPVVRLHLYAHRFETLYGEVQELLGVTDADFGDDARPPNGRYLGMGDKYLVLLFQKKSDIARYYEHFCGFRTEASMRWHHEKTQQMLSAIAAESLKGFDASAIQAHVVYNVAHSLFAGFRGNHVPMPLWLDEGLAHHFALQVPSEVTNVRILDDEAVPEARIGGWAISVRKRAQHDGVSFPFDRMAAWKAFDEMGYYAHSQSWSRVDYLLQLAPRKVGELVKGLKAIPPRPNELVPHEVVATRTLELLRELFGLDPQSFDERWRAWVQKTYPKK